MPHLSALSPTTLSIITVSYGEGEAFAELLPRLVAVRWNDLAGPALVRLLAVNDLGQRDPALEEVCARHGALLVDAPYNMGAQEAFIFGLRQEAEHLRSDYVLTLDGDGQDDPAAIPALLAAAVPGAVAVARRTGRRPEGLSFELGYRAYRHLFHFFVGFPPDFGNFAAFDRTLADHIARSPHFDTAYSMALPLVGRIVRVPVPRLSRSHGETRTGYRGLFDHALRSMLPHLRFIAMRMALLTAVVATVGFGFVGVSSALRLFAPAYAFPNWATTIAFGVVIICLQLFQVCLLLFLVACLTRQIAITRRAPLAATPALRPPR